MAESLALPRGLVEDIRLAITEAFTNVVRHAYLDNEGPVEIGIDWGADSITIIVTDKGRGMRPNPGGGGAGLGLPLITAVTESLNVVQPAGGGSALHMCFRTATGRFQPTS